MTLRSAHTAKLPRSQAPLEQRSLRCGTTRRCHPRRTPARSIPCGSAPT